MSGDPLPDHIKKSLDEARPSGFWALGLTGTGVALVVIGFGVFGRNHPNLAYLFVVVGCLLLTVSPFFLHDWVIGRIPLKTFKKSPANRDRIEKLIAGGLPYGFYLRDFGPESKPIYRFVPISGTFTVYQDHVENTLVRELSDLIPFFALMNVSDADESPVASRIYCEDKDWFERFTHYAGNASLLIVNVDNLTPNVRLEIDWIFKANRKCQVLILTTYSGIEQFRSDYPGIEKKCWLEWRTMRKDDSTTGHPLEGRGPVSREVPVPHDVREFVRTLLLPEIEEIRVLECVWRYDGRCLVVLVATCQRRKGGTVSIGHVHQDIPSGALRIPAADSSKTPEERYYLAQVMTLDLDPEPEKIRKALQPIQLKIRGSRELDRVEKIITLGDRPEFDLMVEQIATKLKEASRP